MHNSNNSIKQYTQSSTLSISLSPSLSLYLELAAFQHRSPIHPPLFLYFPLCAFTALHRFVPDLLASFVSHHNRSGAHKAAFNNSTMQIEI